MEMPPNQKPRGATPKNSARISLGVSRFQIGCGVDKHGQRCGGSVMLSASNAARTRSRFSSTALSGCPTMVKEGRLLAMCACTSMCGVSMILKGDGLYTRNHEELSC